MLCALIDKNKWVSAKWVLIPLHSQQYLILPTEIKSLPTDEINKV